MAFGGTTHAMPSALRTSQLLGNRTLLRTLRATASHHQTCVAWPVEQGDCNLTKLFGNGCPCRSGSHTSRIHRPNNLLIGLDRCKGELLIWKKPPLTSRQPRGLTVGASSWTASLEARTNRRTFCRTGANHVDWALAGSRFSIASHSATGSPATQPLWNASS